MVRSLLTTKVHVYVDDGRRWLIAHPEEKYDLIVANTTYHWRDHASTLYRRNFLTGSSVFERWRDLLLNIIELTAVHGHRAERIPLWVSHCQFSGVSDSPITFNTSMQFSLMSQAQAKLTIVIFSILQTQFCNKCSAGRMLRFPEPRTVRPSMSLKHRLVATTVGKASD